MKNLTSLKFSPFFAHHSTASSMDTNSACLVGFFVLNFYQFLLILFFKPVHVIVPPSNNLILVNKNAADWNFLKIKRLFRKFKGNFNVIFIFFSAHLK